MRSTVVYSPIESGGRPVASSRSSSRIWMRRGRFSLVAALCVGGLAGLSFKLFANHQDDPSLLLEVDAKGRRLTFREEFETLDLKRWSVERSLDDGGNGEFQAYTDDPAVVFVRRGKLVVQPRPMSRDSWAHLADETKERLADETKERGEETRKLYNALERPAGLRYALSDGSSLEVARCSLSDGSPPSSSLCSRKGRWDAPVSPVVSARLSTRHSYAMLYGELRVRLRLPIGDWLWPAFWMLPADSQYGQSWPFTGEIDLVETRANFNYTVVGDDTEQSGPGGNDRLAATIHCADSRGKDSYSIGNTSVHGLLDGEGYVTLGLERTPTTVRTFALENTGEQRDLATWTSKDEHSGPHCTSPEYTANAPFDQPFYVLINVAVGGDDAGGVNFWGDNALWRACKHETGCEPRTYFYEHIKEWHPTWTRPLEIDWIRVYEDPVVL